MLAPSRFTLAMRTRSWSRGHPSMLGSRVVAGGAPGGTRRGHSLLNINSAPRPGPGVPPIYIVKNIQGGTQGGHPVIILCYKHNMFVHFQGAPGGTR